MSGKLWRADARPIIEALEQLGWSELGGAAWQQMRTRIKKAEQQGDAYVGISAFEFDTEAIDGCGPDAGYGSYYAIIQLYASHSWGKFNPQKIVDEWIDNDTKARVGFTLGGRQHEVTVKIDSDWFQSEVHELINEALKEAGVAEQFVLLPVIDQVAYVAFVPPSLFARAEEAGVIPSFQELAEELV